MRKKSYYLVLLAGVLCFTSCEKEIIERVEVPVEVEIQRISFEGVLLNENGFQNNFPNGLILSDADFSNDYDPEYSSWEGFAVSNNTDKETAGYANQYSVYDLSGANGSEKFAVAFYSFRQETIVQFIDNKEHVFKSLMINNATFPALSIQNGDAFTKKFESGDWFKIIIEGVEADGTKAGKVEFYLADFRDGKTFVCSEWTNVDLTQLGKVNKLLFTFESTDVGEWGMNTPGYACIDDIVYYVSE